MPNIRRPGFGEVIMKYTVAFPRRPSSDSCQIQDHSLMNLALERTLPIVLFFVFLMLTLIGVVFYQSTASLQEALADEQRARRIVSRLEATMTTALDAEASMWAFITTGNSTYDENYERARSMIAQNLSEVRGELLENPQNSDRLGKVNQALNEFWAVTGEKIRRRKQNGPDVAFELGSRIETKRVVDGLRDALYEIRAVETDAVRSNRAVLEVSLRQTILVLLIASLAGVISLIIANILVWSEGRRRARAEAELIATNRGLEKSVEERTNELRVVNESLLAIAAEREILLAGEKEARKEAEIANRLRDEFMASVSHELRTPLNSILGWARLIKNGDLDDRQTKKAVTTIIKNSETQNRLIEDLLDVARLISGKLTLKEEVVSLRELLSDAIDAQRPAARKKNISIKYDYDDCDAPIIVRGDAGRLAQVISNLLANAIKFTPEDGVVDVDCSVDGSEVEVTVADNGMGISPEFLPQVFERFRQDTVSDGRNGGLGLGLAIVRNLVEMHGGTVKALSDGENAGATFVVRLPTQTS